MRKLWPERPGALLNLAPISENKWENYSVRLFTLVRLTFEQLKKYNSRNYKIFFRWKDAVSILLFSLKPSSRANQARREKDVWEIFLERIEQGVYHNLLQEMHVSDKESHFR